MLVINALPLHSPQSVLPVRLSKITEPERTAGECIKQVESQPGKARYLTSGSRDGERGCFLLAGDFLKPQVSVRG